MDAAVKSDMDEINKLTNLLDNYIGENGTEEGNNTNGGETTEPEKLNASKYTWTQNKTTVTGTPKSGSGKAVTLTVGEEYDYSVTGVTGGYTGKWGVLGAGKAGTTEAGKLLIMTKSDITTEKLTLSGKEGYNTGISQMNTLCVQKCGTGARSINVDDINRVTGYDPTNQGDGTVAYADEWWEYGNVAVYTESQTTSTKVTKPYTGGLYNGKYEHPDERTIGVSESSNPVTSITEASTAYKYYPHSLTTDSDISGECKGISTTSPAYEMIFGTYANTSVGTGNQYWLASSCIRTPSSYSTFGFRYVEDNGYVYRSSLWYSYGDVKSPSYAVRAVISL